MGEKKTGTAEVKSSSKEEGWILLGIHHSEAMAGEVNASVPGSFSLVNSKQPGNTGPGKQGNAR